MSGSVYFYVTLWKLYNIWKMAWIFVLHSLNLSPFPEKIWNLCSTWKTKRQNSACPSVFQFGKLALWNNLVMRSWSYKNYFKIKYRPYQPSPKNQPSLDQYRLCFSAKTKQIVQKLNLSKKWGVISFLIRLVPNLLCATHTHTLRQHYSCTDINTCKVGWTQGESVPGNEMYHYFCNSLQQGIKTWLDSQHHFYSCL